MSGAQRISKDATEVLRDAIEEFGMQIAEKSISFTRHGGRVTVKGKDVKLALKNQ